VSRAVNYRRQAQALLDRDNDLDCAGALIYESAKQCINALANQQGSNPAATGAKERFLFGFIEHNDIPPGLVSRWKFATRLHVHADRGHLEEPDFMEHWRETQVFIEQMLRIIDLGE
jgi:hypothetical protein